MKPTTYLLAALLCLIAALTQPPAARAFPKYAKAEGVPCAYCHLSKGGGGPRNYRGLYYAATNHTFAGFDDVAEAKKAGVEIAAAAGSIPVSIKSTPAPALVADVDPRTAPDFAVVKIGGMEFVKIPAGRYVRGTTEAARTDLQKRGMWSSANADETPARPVEVTRPFLLARYEVTQKEWTQFMGGTIPNPSAFKSSDRLPVDTVSWDEATTFCKALTTRSQKAFVFRLPTEAEWEYAARGGSDSLWGAGADKNPLTPQTLASVCQMSARATAPVGSKAPNAWGLCDMQGNVWEWCADAYSPTAYRDAAERNPVYRSPIATERVLRGGCWYLDARAARVGLRGGNVPAFKSQYVGFRLVCDIP